MCGSMVDIQSPTAALRLGEEKRKKKERGRNYMMKIYMDFNITKKYCDGNIYAQLAGKTSDVLI